MHQLKDHLRSENLVLKKKKISSPLGTSFRLEDGELQIDDTFIKSFQKKIKKYIPFSK